MQIRARLIIGIVLLVGTRGIVRAVDSVWDKAHMVHEYKEPEEDPSDS